MKCDTTGDNVVFGQMILRGEWILNEILYYKRTGANEQCNNDYVCLSTAMTRPMLL